MAERIIGKIAGDVKNRFNCGKKESIGKFPSPPGLTWSDITITFISNDGVNIKAKDVVKRYTYAEMGFKDGRKGDVPDSRWASLREIFGKNKRVEWNTDIDQKTKTNLKRTVSDIRHRLKTFFNIEDDPFHSYKKHRAYLPKFCIKDNRHIETDTDPTDSEDPFWDETDPGLTPR